jgi:2-haloacid dehalogenase
MSAPVAPPPWLAGVQLITFDVFGTLLDWQTALDKVEIRGREECSALDELLRDQTGRESWIRYTDVLRQAIAQLKPALRPAMVGVFAEDLGRTPLFADSLRALHGLREVVKVGLVGNCDAQHQVDAVTALRVVPDVSITSQEIRAYKPTERAWDAIVRMGVMRAAVTRDNWLHVAHSSRSDLVPARSKGLRTCQVLRTGHEERANADLTVHSLDELVAMVVAAKQGPLLCEIDNLHTDAGERSRLGQWLLTEMLPAVRQVAGVRSAALVERDDGTLVEQYVFGGRAEYDAYVEAFAAEHRANLRDEFGRAVERTVRLSRIRGRV